MIGKAFLGAVTILVLLGCSDTSETQPESKPIAFMTVADMFPGDEMTQALAQAVSKGDIREIDALVAQGADVNAQGTRGYTPLIWALSHPNKKGFKRLLEHGADPNLQNPGSDFSPLYWAVMRSSPMTDNLNLDYLRMMFEIGNADPNLHGLEWGKMPVEWAMLSSEEYIFALFVEQGLNIDQTGGHDVSLVNCASSVKNFKLVYWMLENGVNYTHVSNHPRSKYRMTLHDSINMTLDYSPVARDPSMDGYMWLWRVVDWLEKRGMTFEIPPEANRPEKLDTTPAVLDSEGRPRVRLSRTVFIHEARLKYPTPFWTHAEDTADDFKTRFQQRGGMISYLSLPREESPEDWTRRHEIIGVYSPGASLEDFSRRSQQLLENQLSAPSDFQVVEKADDSILYRFQTQGTTDEGVAWVGRCNDTFLLVFQAWKRGAGKGPDFGDTVLDQMRLINSEPVFAVEQMPEEWEKTLN